MRLALAGGAATLMVLGPHVATADEPRTFVGAGVHATPMPDGRWSLAPAVSLRHRLRVDPWLRLHAGASLVVRGLTQSEMPQALSVRESDVVGRAEVGLGLAGPVHPALSIGAGGMVRRLRLTSDLPGASASPISSTELLPVLDVELSLGLPVRRGTVVIEAFVRRQWCLGDARLDHAVGLDVRASFR